MKEYLQNLILNIKHGNYTTEILITINLIIYALLIGVGIAKDSLSLCILSIIWFPIGMEICSNWENCYLKIKKYR